MEITDVTRIPERPVQPSSAQQVKSTTDVDPSKQVSNDPVAHRSGSESDAKEVEKIIEQVNDLASKYSNRMKFGLYEDTNQLYVQVINTDTNETMKTIPSESFLKFKDKLQDMIGLALDSIL